MAPGNKERHPGHTGTIPKTKARNNCNVPQEAVTPTRRDMTTNLVTTSLDWVPVSEYNTRTNCNQSRKPTNNTSDQELADLDNSVSYESGFGRFVPVRPQPRALPLTVQNRENISVDHNDDGASSSISSHTLHHFQNGSIPHSNHAAAAVMIVNPTTPNAVTGNMSQPFNAPNQNRNNLTRNLNSTRNTFDGNTHASNNNITPPLSNSRTGNKTVNLINNMYDQGQGSFNNLNENNQVHRESARALGEAIVAACPDAAAVERRLGQIREYIRVTSSLVDTMRNSEDEAFIEHTKEEYDELIQMVTKLKESESKLESMLVKKIPHNVEVSPAEAIESATHLETNSVVSEMPDGISLNKLNHDEGISKSNNENIISNNLKKVTNIENEQLNKTMSNTKINDDNVKKDMPKITETLGDDENKFRNGGKIEENESCDETETKHDDQHLNDDLRKNIISCVEKVAIIEEMKNKINNYGNNHDQDVVIRPVSVQSNGSAYSDNELWQNEIKNKMEMSQIRLSALKQQQKRLLKYQAEAKQQLEEMKERQAQEIHPSTSNENFAGMQNMTHTGNYNQHNRMYGANQIGVATTLPQSSDSIHGGHQMANNIENEHGHSAQSTHSQDERFSNREDNISEEAAVPARDSEGEEDDSALHERSQMLQLKLRELQLRKQHMENLVSEFRKLQMATGLASSHNTYSSSGEDSAEDEPPGKCNKPERNLKNEDPFKLMEIKAIKTALQKTKDLMRSVETFEADHLSNSHEDSFPMSSHSNIHDNKSEGGGSMGGWSNEGSVCRVRNSLPQRHKFTNEQHHQHYQQQQHHHQQQQNYQQQNNQLQQNQQQQQPPQLQQPQHHRQQQQFHQHQQQQHQQQQHHTQQQHHQQQREQQQSSPEANIASLQELAQELRMATEEIMGERARIEDILSNKEISRKQKKVNEEQRAPSGGPGPAERRQMQLRALLAEKQRELETLLNKEVICGGAETQKKPDSRAMSVANQSYNSEHEEQELRSEQLPLDSNNSRENDHFRSGGDNVMGGRSINAVPSRLESNYGSDTDSASRNKSNQRNRPRRRQTQVPDDNTSQINNTIPNVRHDTRSETSNVNMVPPVAQNGDNPINIPYGQLPPQCWNGTKSNQDIRTNQFTQNSHSQTMERLLGTPMMSCPPTMPFNMMMPYGMVGGCGCGCSFWGAWCWQQLIMQQREIHQFREQLSHLEERWRAETASHTLNNQVPPGNRANNYWDNFRRF